ncbi:lysine exporter LysO family protein [Metallosphaera tengchongensis]|uniref:Lysine exporter LysO family protein n=2 Tax=Metallosphaera tengchongensis TaxID=1532350 RepID=A0A6N0P1F8_9CREN|nr:lysine exporter LysO family protein [Metallosphaera tengchongensis]
MLLYVAFLGIGKIGKRSFPKVGDSVVLLLIFSISLWGGAKVISVNALTGILSTSLILSLLVVLLTFAGGLALKKTVPVRGSHDLALYQLKYGAPLLLGIALGFLFRPDLPFSSLIDYELYALAIVIGFNMGSEIRFRAIFNVTKDATLTMLVVFLGAIISSVVAFALGIVPNLKLSLAIFMGSGWYSYTGPIVSSYYGPIYGVIAFLTNFFREQLAFLLIPLLVRVKSNPYSAIAIGGATSMDTTLGLYSSIFGGDYSVSAMMSGAVLTLVIPIILPLILGV